jgi:hypothetical protein
MEQQMVAQKGRERFQISKTVIKHWLRAEQAVPKDPLI